MKNGILLAIGLVLVAGLGGLLIFSSEPIGDTETEAGFSATGAGGEPDLETTADPAPLRSDPAPAGPADPPGVLEGADKRLVSEARLLRITGLRQAFEKAPSKMRGSQLVNETVAAILDARGEFQVLVPGMKTDVPERTPDSQPLAMQSGTESRVYQVRRAEFPEFFELQDSREPLAEGLVTAIRSKTDLVLRGLKP